MINQLPTYLNDNYDFQAFISVNFINQMFSTLYKAGILTFYITQMPSNLSPPYNTFLKSLNTDFIYAFIPEIEKNNTGFLPGSPCILKCFTCGSPIIGMNGNSTTFQSCLNIDIMCVKNYSASHNNSNNYTQVVTIKTL